MLSVFGEEAARHTQLDGEHFYMYMINQSFVFSVLAAAAAAARYTIPSNITLQPSCLSTHSLCCAEHSCLMASSSIPEPSPKLAPQQQMKSSPSAGYSHTLCSQAVLSKEGCSRGPCTVDAVLILTPLSSSSLPFSPLLRAVRSWYEGCCCVTRGLRVCSIVPPLPLYYKGFKMGVVCIENCVA